jgi:hypothetical protein
VFEPEVGTLLYERSLIREDADLEPLILSEAECPLCELKRDEIASRIELDALPPEK